MTDRTRLAEKLEERYRSAAPVGLETTWITMTDLREAAEWLRRGCETCQHGEPWPVVAGCLYCRHVQDHCDVMGNGCNAWEARP